MRSPRDVLRGAQVTYRVTVSVVARPLRLLVWTGTEFFVGPVSTPERWTPPRTPPGIHGIFTSVSPHLPRVRHEPKRSVV